MARDSTKIVTASHSGRPQRYLILLMEIYRDWADVFAVIECCETVLGGEYAELFSSKFLAQSKSLSARIFLLGRKHVRNLSDTSLCINELINLTPKSKEVVSKLGDLICRFQCAKSLLVWMGFLRSTAI